jgi:hypothetical protein
VKDTHTHTHTMQLMTYTSGGHYHIPRLYSRFYAAAAVSDPAGHVAVAQQNVDSATQIVDL